MTTALFELPPLRDQAPQRAPFSPEVVMATTRPTLSFLCPGVPQPGGSKKGFFNPKIGRVVIVEDAKRNAPWRAVVTLAAQTAVQAFHGTINTPDPTTTFPLTGPLAVRFKFTFPRPTGHFGSGRNASNLKPSAPPWPATRPDCTKIIRSTEDALTGILWADDARIVHQVAGKLYGDKPGALVEVWTLPATLG
jgi:Holliday junction resolvase RusA-like endonuclease